MSEVVVHTENSTVAGNMTLQMIQSYGHGEADSWAGVTAEGTFNASGTSGSVNIAYVKKQKRPLRIMFKAIKKNLKAMTIMERRVLNRRLVSLNELAEKAIDTGQIALAEDCIRLAEIQAREAGIYAYGIRHFIPEPVLDKFIKWCQDGRDVLKTPIEEFTRIMPVDVQKKLKDCQNRNLFDRYIVVHYDPDLDAISEKEKEVVEKKRDPILFGQIKQTDHMYFIADWIDEYCDLTFDEVLGFLRLGESEMTLDKRPTFAPEPTVDPEVLEKALKRRFRRVKKQAGKKS